MKNDRRRGEKKRKRRKREEKKRRKKRRNIKRTKMNRFGRARHSIRQIVNTYKRGHVVFLLNILSGAFVSSFPP